MSEFETITLDVSDEIATITLNVPEKMNACGLPMADEINHALDKLGGARALIFTGAGRGFCSGADLSGGRASDISGGQGSYKSLMNHYNPMLVKLHRLDIPTIGAINGPAAGVGCSIALANDFVIASDKAYFLQAFVNIGLVPDGGASWMLSRLVGKARATELMMLGEKLTAEKAYEWGAIHKVVDADSLMPAAQELARRLAAMPTVALGQMRRNLAEAMECDFATALIREAEGQRVAGDSEDAREGAMAFLQKRKPEFKGR